MMKHEIKMQARFFTDEELETIRYCLENNTSSLEPKRATIAYKLLEEW